MRFAGRVAFITGAGGGIGEACAQRFLAEGASVVIADRSASLADRVAKSLGDPDRTEALGFDITDPAEVNGAFDAALARYGKIDLLVNCAGVASIHPTTGIPDEEWRRVHAINLDGTFYASRAFVRAAIDAGRPGAIVNLASVAGILAIPDRPAYISSKHAVVGLTREMALEFGAAGIRVNAIAPGVMETPMTEGSRNDPARRAYLMTRIPIRDSAI